MGGGIRRGGGGVLEEGGGVWNPKICGPKMAKIFFLVNFIVSHNEIWVRGVPLVDWILAFEQLTDSAAKTCTFEALHSAVQQKCICILYANLI